MVSKYSYLECKSDKILCIYETCSQVFWYKILHPSNIRSLYLCPHTGHSYHSFQDTLSTYSQQPYYIVRTSPTLNIIRVCRHTSILKKYIIIIIIIIIIVMHYHHHCHALSLSCNIIIVIIIIIMHYHALSCIVIIVIIIIIIVIIIIMHIIILLYKIQWFIDFFRH